MAIQRMYDTTVERLKNIFNTKLLSFDESYMYFRSMHPINTINVFMDIIDGCLLFIRDYLDTYKYEHSDEYKSFKFRINNNTCYINIIPIGCNPIEITIYNINNFNMSTISVRYEDIYVSNILSHIESFGTNMVINCIMDSIASILNNFYIIHCKNNTKIK